jgi:hypothetical protein
MDIDDEIGKGEEDAAHIVRNHPGNTVVRTTGEGPVHVLTINR